MAGRSASISELSSGGLKPSAAPSRTRFEQQSSLPTLTRRRSNNNRKVILPKIMFYEQGETAEGSAPANKLTAPLTIENKFPPRPTQKVAAKDTTTSLTIQTDTDRSPCTDLVSQREEPDEDTSAAKQVQNSIALLQGNMIFNHFNNSEHPVSLQPSSPHFATPTDSIKFDESIKPSSSLVNGKESSGFVYEDFY